jgi:DNA-binding transcriptional LysR family regulator
MYKNLRSVDLNLLIALDVLLEELHVSRAADKLSLSQSATSRVLTRLRETFNDPLLIRTSDGMIMTARAEQLKPQVKENLINMQRLFVGDEFFPLKTTRSFRFRATGYVAQAYLPRIVSRITNEAPNCEVTIGNLTAKSFTSKEESEIDLLICGNGFNVPQNYKVRPLGSDEMVCIMSKDHPLAYKELTLEDYISYGHCQMSLGNNTGASAIDEQLAQLGVKRHISLKMSHIMACLEITGNSELLHTNGSNIAKKYLKTFNLIIKPLPFEFPHLSHSLYWHPVHHHNPAHIWLRKLAIEEIQKSFTQDFKA